MSNSNRQKVKEKKDNTEKEEKVVNKKKSLEKGDKKTKEKYRFEIWEVIVIMVIATLFGLFIGSFVVYKAYNNDKIKCNEVDSNINSFTSVYNGILDDYYGYVDSDKMTDYAISGMIDSLEDPYASFISEEEALYTNEDLDGMFVGLGVNITNDNNRIKVVSVKNDSPASKAGILPNDIIISIDSLEVNYDNVEELLKTIKTSKNGDRKVLNVLRGEKSIRISVTLEVIEIKSVFSSINKRNGNNIGIISITNFASNTYNQFVEEYYSLLDDDINGLVIDLRDNVGGYLTSMYSIATMFLEKDDVVYQKTDGKTTEKIINEFEKRVDIPVVLLVNGYTASSSEIFVSCLKDNLNISVVGTKTYGKGTIQKVESIGNGRYVKYTVQEWLTANGKKVDGIGIVPDVIIPYDDKVSNDVQLDKALEIISNKIGE